MLSLARCREILGLNVDLSDEELLKLRAHLYALAQTAVDGFAHEQNRAAA